MRSMVKLIWRFVITLIVSLVILLFLNLVLLAVTNRDYRGNGLGYQSAEKVAQALTETAEGEYELSAEGERLLEEKGAWALLVQDGTGDVIWHSSNLPREIPLHYSAAEISWYTRGYIEDYPTTTAAKGGDLVVIGNPKDSYWKHLYPIFDLNMIRNTPQNILLFLGVNLLIIIGIYFVVTLSILRQVKPILCGIEALPEGGGAYVKEKGLLSDLAITVNRVSEKLCDQEYTLQKKEQARANWISGVSHDIRTPLSMVMGYGAEIEEEEGLPESVRRKAGVIRQQSGRMKKLVEDLNLASKMEYHMQPLRMESVSLDGLIRETAADFMNMDMDGKYPVELSGDFPCAYPYRIQGDRELLKRALGNLFWNAKLHNPEGCGIRVELSREGNCLRVLFEDDGVGVTGEQMRKLQNTPHYMLSDDGGGKSRHGLGLLIVQQIVTACKGRVAFDHGRMGGFCVELLFDCGTES